MCLRICTGFKGVSFRETHLWEHFGRTDKIALITCLKNLNVSGASLTNEWGVWEDFYGKGNSVKRSGPFNEPPDSENWKVAGLIPFPNINSYSLSLSARIRDDPNTTTTIFEFIFMAPFLFFGVPPDAAPNATSTQWKNEKTCKDFASDVPSSAVLMRHKMQTFYRKSWSWLCLVRPCEKQEAPPPPNKKTPVN